MKFTFSLLVFGFLFTAIPNVGEAGWRTASRNGDAFFRPWIYDYHLYRIHAQRWAPTGHKHYVADENGSERRQGPDQNLNCPPGRRGSGALTRERHHHSVGSAENAVYPHWRGYKHTIHPHNTHDHPDYQTAPHIDYQQYQYAPVPPQQYFGTQPHVAK